MESLNISPQTIELNPICSRQAQSNRPGISHGHEITMSRFIHTVLRVPSEIRELIRADDKSAKVD